MSLTHLAASLAWLSGCFPGPIALGDVADMAADAAAETSETAELDSQVTAEDASNDADTPQDSVADSSTEVSDAATGLDAPTVETDACQPTGSEVCNGLDDNCNGSTDEGYTDTNTDSVADCVDDDDDGDGILDEVDDEPLIPWTDPCTDVELIGSMVGCAFWSVDLPTFVVPDDPFPPSDVPHWIVVTNPSSNKPAKVEMERIGDGGGASTARTTIPPGSSVTLMSSPSDTPDGISDNGVLLTADRPVSVMQVNPGSSAGSSSSRRPTIPRWRSS